MKKLILFVFAFNCWANLFARPAIAKESGFHAVRTYVITNVDVIPMDRERVLRNRNVTVTKGIITGISAPGKTPDGAITIDGTGKYLIPGLVDMHTHLFSDYEFPDSLAADELKIMLANGVTTIRLMIGTPEHLKLRQQSALGKILAPTIYAASPQFAGRSFGDIYNGYVVTNETQARESVRKAKSAGYDFIKLTFWIARPVYDAVIDEAKKQNIRVIGHVDPQVGLTRVFETGQQIEHLDGYFEALVPNEAESKLSTSGVAVWNRKAWESIDILDESKIPELAKRAVKANKYSVPTLTFLKLAFGSGQTDEEITSRADYRFLPEKIRNEMAGPRKAFWSDPPSEKRRARYVNLRNRIVKAIYDAGGKVLAGSDAPEWYLLYGYTLHRELESLTEAGLSNYAALEAATRNPAEFFETLESVGTIETGKRADLVLLDSNPLSDISSTGRIAGVMIKGIWIPKEETKKMLDEIAQKFQRAFESGSGASNDSKPKLFEADNFFASGLSGGRFER